jgi:hypothetical protein
MGPFYWRHHLRHTRICAAKPGRQSPLRWNPCFGICHSTDSCTSPAGNRIRDSHRTALLNRDNRSASFRCVRPTSRTRRMCRCPSPTRWRRSTASPTRARRKWYERCGKVERLFEGAFEVRRLDHYGRVVLAVRFEFGYPYIQLGIGEPLFSIMLAGCRKLAPAWV